MYYIKTIFGNMHKNRIYKQIDDIRKNYTEEERFKDMEQYKNLQDLAKKNLTV